MLSNIITLAKDLNFQIIAEGNIALGKLAQAIMYGATVIQIEGNFDEGLEIVKALSENEHYT